MCEYCTNVNLKIRLEINGNELQLNAENMNGGCIIYYVCLKRKSLKDKH